ncbi:pyrroline-5-carboxylate reductase family protein [Streptomyces sp. NPDC059904]|uniref:pyrroline-5-carboxylate reductase family protein n=1 Tax=Streptomyces sp. NPDC059904 TaxID=3346996 RepID=UPI00365FC6CB
MGVVGLGRMGQTLAAGFNTAIGGARLFAAGRSPSSVARFREAMPNATILPLSELPDHADLIILCVRNRDLPTVLDEMRPGLTPQHVVITINNGLSLEKLAAAVEGPVAKLIPSVGNELGAGATLLVPGPRLTTQATEDLLALLRAFSTPFVIEENQGRAATDLASCGPALLAGAAEAMIDAQQVRGAPLSRELAEQLVTQSLHVLSRLLDQGSRLDDIVNRVAVPGGNTAAALDAGRDGLTAAWHVAFQATADNERSKAAPPLRTGRP